MTGCEHCCGDQGTFMGLSLLVGCVGEVIVFTYADTFIKRHGVLNVFNGVFLLMGTLLHCCFTRCFTAALSSGMPCRMSLTACSC